MSLADLTGHLEDLASSQSGLRRSRAMAQLWSEIRSSDVEDRRAFALALADRFAPSLSVKFAEQSGLDGPEFIRLVRSLIEMDGEDIHDVVNDLTQLGDNPIALAEEITVAELIETADQLTDESGRDDLMNDVFERLVDAADDIAEPPAEVAEPADPMPGIAPLPDVSVMSTNDAEVQPLTPFDRAMERMADIDDDDESGAQIPATRITESDRFDPADRTDHRESVPAGSPTSELETDGPRHRGLVAAAPDGWRRRRLISSLIRDGRIGVGEALALSDQLSRPSDVRWVIGDLIERGLTLSDRALLASRELPANMRRRLELAP